MYDMGIQNVRYREALIFGPQYMSNTAEDFEWDLVSLQAANAVLSKLKT